MTREEYQEAILAICPLCRRGLAVRKRLDTSEFVHDYATGASMSHTLCLASGLRNSRFAEDAG